MKRCCLLILTVVTLAGCTQAPARDTSKVPSAGSAAPVPSPSARRAADWAEEVDSGCRVGLAMYPSLALGVDADVDTVALGVRTFHESLSRVPPPDDAAGREQARLLVRRTRDLDLEWQGLATAATVPSARREAAVAHARSVILAVAAIGAPSCEELAPGTTGEDAAS